MDALIQDEMEVVNARRDVEMTEELSDQEARRRAERRVEAILGFKQHAMAYCLVNGVIFIIWLVVALSGGTWFPWFIFPLLGWGIGLGINAWVVYGGGGYEQRHERMVQAEMDKIRSEQGHGEGGTGE